MTYLSTLSELKDLVLFKIDYFLYKNRSVIAHHGIQRSGTNYINYVLRQSGVIIINRHDPSRTSPCHKHFRWQRDKGSIKLDMKYMNHITADDLDALNKKCGYSKSTKHVVIHRDVRSWLCGIYSWAMRVSWLNGEISDNDIETFMKVALKEWIEYYEFWSSVSDNRVVFVSYDAFFSRDPECILSLERFLDIKLLEDAFDVDSVPRSPKGKGKHDQRIYSISDHVYSEFLRNGMFDSIKFMVEY